MEVIISPEAQIARRTDAKQKVASALLVVLALAALAYFVWQIQKAGFNWTKFTDSFRQANPFWLTLAIITSFLTYPGRALRWRILMRPVSQHARVWNLINATIVGFSAIVLFGRAGEMVRPYLIARKERVTIASQVAAWILERVYDLLAVLLIFGYALTQVQENVAGLGTGLQWVVRTGGYLTAFICLVCIVILGGMRWFSGPMERRFLDSITFLPENVQLKLRELVQAFTAGVKSTRSGTFTLLILGYTVLEWVIIFGCNYFLFKSFPATAHLGVRETLIYLSFVAFGSIVQIPGIGGGMQVVSIVVLRELFGLGLEEATGVTVLIWLATYVVVVPVGVLVALREGLNWGGLKHISAEEAS
ncbi:MAG TPA: lysylphosphatidylglycerol synthase transmembrane domain-containing protein [Bryobacteraceae bacterium]|nr:lysylphosphatidylglycerol synthase transmembrane domain-containing protein [Bryobacteraceae bacterium]